MTKEAAIELMHAGKKVTHTYFTDEEYLHEKNGEICTEDGYVFDTLFDERNSYLSDGWEEFKE